MKSIILTLLLVLSSSIYGQIDIYKALKEEELILDEGALPHIIMKQSCYGSTSTCKLSSTGEEIGVIYEYYIISIEGNTLTLSRINPCVINKISVSSDKDNPLQYAIEHFEDIKIEKVKPYTLKDKSNIIVDHSCHYSFSISNGKAKLEKYFNEFDLESNEKDINIYFDFNNQLYLPQLMHKIRNLQ